MSAFRIKSRLICFLVMTAGAACGWAQSSTTVDWSNSAATLLKDSAGAPLAQATASANNDGMLVQLGYYSSATTSNKFSGAWIPLTGIAGRPRTTIGDSFNFAGAGDGMLQFNTFFQTGTATVEVYDASDPGHYQTQSSVAISATTPPDNQILAIRFYDTADGASGHYNTVSSDTWRWLTPASFGPVIDISLSNSTLAFEDAGNVFKTSITVPPPAPTPTATPTATPTPAPTPAAGQALNISTRLRVETGDNLLIGGFIITGNASKPVVLRGLGPSLVAFGLRNVLLDPALELRGSNGALIMRNDNWKESPERSQIEGTVFQPTDDREAVILATLQAGSYTASLTGVGQTTGVGLMEIYDNNQAADSQLANISTRGFVQTADNVMIGGFILGGNNNPARVAVRGLGPSLAQFGLSPVLADPTLELRDANGTITISNDNWSDDPVSAAQLSANGLALQDSHESGIFASLPPGQFTVILAGKNGGVGIGLVEIYNLR